MVCFLLNGENRRSKQVTPGLEEERAGEVLSLGFCRWNTKCAGLCECGHGEGAREVAEGGGGRAEPSLMWLQSFAK